MYEALDLIERRTGVDLVLPPGMTHEDLPTIGTIVKILETGKGMATFENGTGVVEADQIATLGDSPQSARIIHRPVTYELFGQTVNLGMGEYEMPPVRVVDVKPLGTKPDAPARVTIAPAGDNQMPFRLLETEAA